MRITHVGAGLGVEAQGVNAVVRGLSSAQGWQGWEVSVAGTSLPQFADRMLEWDGVNAATHSVVGPRSFGFSPDLLTGIKRTRPDVIHAHGLWMYPLLAAFFSARNSGVPLFVSPHGMLTQVALSFSPYKKKVANLLYQNRCLSGAAVLHATSAEEVEDIRRYGLSQPIALVPNGITLPKLLHDPTRSNKRSVLSLGRIHPKKGLDVLIGAWGVIERDFPQWELVIAGPDEGGHRAHLERLAHRAGLKSVRFMDPIYGERKNDLMASSSLFALPTRSENFAMTVAESLAVETPVISSTGAPWARLEQEGCGWWVKGDRETFAKTLRVAMSLSDAQRKKMGEAGRRWMEREFSWANIASKMVEAYEWCRTGGSAPGHVFID